MPRYLATYDLKSTNPDPHSEVLKQLRDVGFLPWVKVEAAKQWYRLPNTTVVGDFATRDAAYSAYSSALSAARRAGFTVVQEKLFLANITEALASSDDTQAVA